MTQAAVTKRKPIFWFHCAVFFFFIFGFGLLPPIPPMEKMGMQVLGIFIGLIYAWTTMDFVWPSLVSMIALSLTGYDTAKNIFLEGFGNDTFLMIFFMFIWSDYLHRSGTLPYVARWMATRKICLGRPWVFTFMLFLASFLTGTMISITVGIIIIWSILYSIFEIYGYKKGDQWPAFILIGTAFSVMIGYGIFPYKAMGRLMIAAYESGTGLEMGFTVFTVSGLLVAFTCLILWLLVGKFVLRPDTSALTANEDMLEELKVGKMNAEVKIGMTTIVVLLALVILPEYFTNPFLLTFKKLGITAITVMILFVLCIIRVDGKPVFDFSESVRSSTVNWDMLILLASTMPISSALSSEKTNVMGMISYYGEPLLSGLSPIVFVIAFALFVLIMTQFAHNIVLIALLSPIFIELGSVVGANLILGVVLCTFASGAACATPGASTPGALIYANTEWISRKRAYGYCIAAVACAAVSIILWGLILNPII